MSPPLTCNLLAGLFVPIPTLPAEVIRNLSLGAPVTSPFVPKVRAVAEASVVSETRLIVPRGELSPPELPFESAESNSTAAII